MNKLRKSVAALNLRKLTASQVVDEAHFIVTSMTGNVNFPAPTPGLTQVTTDANNLDASVQAAKTRARGTGSHVAAMLKAIKVTLKLLVAYVENIANATPDHADTIIISSGMFVKKHTPIIKADFSVKAGKNTGEAVLVCKASPHSTYVFEMTTDPSNPALWMAINKGTKSRYTKTGLTSGKLYYFRVTRTDKNGEHPASIVLSLGIA
jgi:hypothetical protein